MPVLNLHQQVAAAFQRSGLTVSEFARRLERRGLKKERSALSRMLRVETSADTTDGELEVMADELGVSISWKPRRKRAA
jgi:hypothetical protein